MFGSRVGERPCRSPCDHSRSTSRRTRLAIVVASAAAGLGVLSTGASFASERSLDVKSVASSSGPPIQRAEFRSGLLDLLTKNAPAGPTLDDVTERTLHVGFLPYCNVTESQRREFDILQVSRVTPERYELFRRRLIEVCGLRIFSRSVVAGTIYVAVYTNAPSGPRGTYIARGEGRVLAVTKAPVPSRESSAVVEAVRLAATALEP